MDNILEKDAQIQRFLRQTAELEKKLQSLKMENTMLKAQNCKKSKTEATISEVQFLKNSL
jgi:cell division protein FtsB